MLTFVHTQRLLFITETETRANLSSKHVTLCRRVVAVCEEELVSQLSTVQASSLFHASSSVVDKYLSS